MPRLTSLTCLLVALLAAIAVPAAAGERLALVIGNAGYRSVPALDNPVNDARLMARTLRAAGFRVTTVIEADRTTMMRAVERFGGDLRTAGPDALGFVHFAGHGVRSDGFNYLLPIGVDIRSEADLAREAVSAEWVQARIRVPGVTSVLVLDACRNNPFLDREDGTIAGLGDGLARMTALEDALIAYATGPGDVALDGTGGNSPYAAALARAIATPGLDLEAIFARVRDEVAAATGGAQVPWARSALDGGVSIRPATRSVAGGRAETPLLSLSVDFRFSPVRWSDDARVCRSLYRFDPVRVPLDPERPRRVRNDALGLTLELSTRAREGGIELVVAPGTAGASGEPVTASLDAIEAGRDRVLQTGFRHPDHEVCGPVTIYLRRDD